jgi:hypothetical protein
LYKAAKIQTQDVAIVLIGFNLSIGTPAQSFQIALSIETDFLMLQSAACKTDCCQALNHTGFNSSQSSTFSGTSDPFVEHFGLVRWEGYHANETVGVGDLCFPSVPFLLADYIGDVAYFHWYTDYDGVLGLSPQSPAWFAIKESGLLEENVIGLKFPSGPFDLDNIDNRDDGELTIGGISPDFSSAPFIDLPLAGGNSALAWATPVQSLAIVNKTIAQPYPLPAGAVAAFASADPFIRLPSQIAHRLFMQVLPNSTDNVLGLPIFPCEMRELLVDVELSFGADNLVWNVTLSPYDYSMRMVRKSVGLDACLLVVVDGEDNAIWLGWPFLRRFYSVFDDGRKLIRCKLSRSLSCS